MTDQTQTTTEPVRERLAQYADGKSPYKAWRGEAPAGEPTLKRDLRAILTTPQPLAIGLDREAVARVIEPSAFQADRWKADRRLMLKFQGDALAKADQIIALYATAPQASPVGGLNREVVARVMQEQLNHLIDPAVIVGATLRAADAILALAAPADGYVLVPVEPELDADMERDLTESDQEAIERGLRTVRAFDAVHDLRSVLSDTMARQHSGYDWNADPDGMTLRQSEAIKQADRALPAAPTGETGA